MYSGFILSPDIVAFAILGVVVLGILGSLYPVAGAVRMRPADAMWEE